MRVLLIQIAAVLAVLPSGVLAADTDTPFSFTTNDRVEVHSLQKALHLNGRAGRLGKYLQAKGRWEVYFPDGKSAAVKPANLVLCSDGHLEVPDVLLAPLTEELVDQLLQLDPKVVADGLGQVYRIRRTVNGVDREHYLIPCCHRVKSDPEMSGRIAKSLHGIASPLTCYMEEKPPQGHFSQWMEPDVFERAFVETFPDSPNGFESEEEHKRADAEVTAQKSRCAEKAPGLCDMGYVVDESPVSRAIDFDFPYRVPFLYTFNDPVTSWGSFSSRTFNDPVTSWGSYLLDEYLGFKQDIAVAHERLLGSIILKDNWRNKLFVDGINAIEEGKPAVILLGAKHFYGDRGVLNLLRDAGWSLSRVPCPEWSATPEATRETARDTFAELCDIVRKKRAQKAEPFSHNMSQLEEMLASIQALKDAFGTGQ